ncbi:peptidylprolyl isomerase [Bdellovibrionota bacterium]
MRKILIFLSIFLVSAFGNAKVVDRIVSVVGDEPITLSELNEFQIQLKKSPRELREEEKKVLENRQAVLEILIEDKIFEKEIVRLGLDAKDAEVESEILNIRERLKLSPKQLKEMLKSKGTSYKEYFSFIKRQIEQRRLIGQVIRSNVTISDEDIINYYQQNVSKSLAKAEYRASQILLKTTPQKEKEIRNRAENIVKRVRAGEGFAKLARQYSEDPTASSGGELGWFRPAEMIPEFQRPISQLKPGEVTDPFKTKLGIHIIYLEDVRMPPPPELTPQLKERIRNLLFQERIAILLKQWFEKMKRDKYVVKKMI